MFPPVGPLGMAPPFFPACLPACPLPMLPPFLPACLPLVDPPTLPAGPNFASSTAACTRPSCAASRYTGCCTQVASFELCGLHTMEQAGAS